MPIYSEPSYSNAPQVRLYLKNKVVADAEKQQKSITTAEIKSFIISAESEVENELSKIYLIPFQTTTGQPFSQLPKTSQVILQNLCTYMAVSKILKIYYGLSEGVRGADYLKVIDEMYENIKYHLVKKDNKGVYISDVLPGLMLNPKASYRSASGIPAPMVAGIGNKGNTATARTLSKLANLNKSFYAVNGYNYKG